MFGKGAILTVFGFMIAFSVYQLKMNRAAMSSVDDFRGQFERTQLYHAKLSAMNVGINRIWNENLTTGNFDLVFDDCSTNVAIAKVGLDSLRIRVRAWASVFDDDIYATTGASMQLSDSVLAYFQYRIPVSKFFWFTENEGHLIYWITGDTVWGPLHTNGTLRTSGTPTFYGKVSAQMGITPLPTTPASMANFYGGWEMGVNNVLDTDMSVMIGAAAKGNGAAPANTKSMYDRELTLNFLPDGRAIRTLTGDAPDTVFIADIAPTGVIYSTETVHVKGTFNGKLSIYSTGNIYIEDDLVYHDDPVANPNSDDLLGLIAGQDVIIADNAANNSDINLQAAIMAMNGSFAAENFKTRPVSGTIHFVGSIYQQLRGPVGTFNSSTKIIKSGFLKNYRFDDRLAGISPPYFPFIRNLSLLGWWE